jgi:uncharacterized protein
MAYHRALAMLGRVVRGVQTFQSQILRSKSYLCFFHNPDDPWRRYPMARRSRSFFLLYYGVEMDETPRFAVDRMLARLARWLRLMGADVLFEPELGGADLLRRARDEDRTLITRDKRFRTAPDAIFLTSNFFREQLREVLARHPFDPRAYAFTRCAHCNEPLQWLDRNLVARRVPPFVFASHEKFACCPRCGKIYWDATHVECALAEIKALMA